MKPLYKILAILFCILVLIVCIVKTADLIGNINSSSQTASTSVSDVSAITQEPSPLALAKADNPDTVAWLRIPNTDIDNPVMQTANNEDYLRRNEKKEDDVWGCYFADYYANLSARENLAQNTVIYGHSESSENPNGKRFTQLFRYLDLDFLKSNPKIHLTVGEQELTFQIFAVFFTDIDFYYIDPRPSEQGFQSFINTVNAKNEFVFADDTITEQDKLLTLSTCAYRYDTEKSGNHRLVVMAKLIYTDAQTPRITANLNPQRP